MASVWRKDGVKMASGCVMVCCQDAVRMMGSLKAGWRQVASGCVRMASGKRQNSIRMTSGSVKVALGLRQDGVRGRQNSPFASGTRQNASG